MPAITIRYLLLMVFFPLASAMAGAQTESGTMTDPRIEEAIALMNGFADRTGLTSEQPPRRYLWTDAFAVCNYISLARITGEQQYMDLALQLVDDVHHLLGRHRDDDKRTGWISGLSEHDGELHPTRGGLRIGKALPERNPDEPFDEQQEWDRDGQYFHYLTKWMHALDQVTRATQQPRFNTWARELSYAASEAFTDTPSSDWQSSAMAWKMSIDLTRAQVVSMGQHDPLDGYITNLQLRSTMTSLGQPATGPNLEVETGRFAAMFKRDQWTTADPLGLGGLMIDAYRVQQLMQQASSPHAQLLGNLISASLSGLEYYARSGELQQPARYRLAFRELGLAIGLHAVERMQQATVEGEVVNEQLEALMRYMPLRDEIEAFWRDPAHQRSNTWTDHREINEVMLATTLAPEGFLVLRSF